MDVQQFFGLATKYQIQQLLLRFFPDASREEVEEFALKVPEGRVAMSALQGYLIKSKDDKRRAIDCIDSWLRSNTDQLNTNQVDIVKSTRNG